MNKFQLTPQTAIRRTRHHRLAGRRPGHQCFLHYVEKGNQYQKRAAASAPAAVEILTPGGSQIVTAQAIPASQQATPSAASDAAASDPENAAASEAPNKQPRPLLAQANARSRRNNQANTEESTNSSTATTSNNRSAATATETPVEPVNRQPARAAEQPAPAPQPCTRAKKKK